MITSTFERFLKELEPFFNCPLVPDPNHSCLIQMKSGLQIQIELDRRGHLLIAAILGTFVASRYRDNLIVEALKSNAVSLPSLGVFGYSQKTNQLVYFLFCDGQNIQVEKILPILPLFMAKAQAWFEALTHGDMPPSQLDSTHMQDAAGLFGLKP